MKRFCTAMAVAMAVTLPAFANFVPSGPLPINDVVTVSWGSPQFASGYVDVNGQVAPGRSGTFRSGVFNLTYQVGSSAVKNSFQTICIDANENIFSGTQLYYVQKLSDYPTFDPAGPSFSDEQKVRLSQLFATYGSASQTSPVKSAAFQWAAWEIARETSTTSSGPVRSVSLNAGDVFIGSSTNANVNAVRTDVNDWLSALGSKSPSLQEAELLIWSPVENINGEWRRVAGQELLTLNPVPEPGAFIPLALGVVFLGLRRYRRAA